MTVDLCVSLTQMGDARGWAHGLAFSFQDTKGISAVELERRLRTVISVGLLVSICPFLFAAEIERGEVGTGYGGGLEVGQQGFGEYTLNGGSTRTYQKISIATGPTSTGVVNINDAGTILTLDGGQNRLDVEQGDGTMTISAGAFVDAASNGDDCDASRCNNFIANAAGSTALLIVTGPGSRLDTRNAFVVGGAAVFTQANDGFDMGIPGAESQATFNILDGAVVHHEGGAEISGGPGGGSPTGTESTVGTTTISGAGSTWNIDDQLAISPRINTQGYLNVTDGGTLTVGNWGMTVAQVATSKAEINITNGGVVKTTHLTISDGSGSQSKLNIDGGSLVGTIVDNYSEWDFARHGNTDIKISNGGRITTGSSITMVVSTGGTADVRLMGKGSTIEAGFFVSFGWDVFGNAAGGSCTVVMTPGSVIRSPAIVVGPGCRVVGRGTLEGTVYNLGTIGRGVEIVP